MSNTHCGAIPGQQAIRLQVIAEIGKDIQIFSYNLSLEESHRVNPMALEQENFKSYFFSTFFTSFLGGLVLRVVGELVLVVESVLDGELTELDRFISSVNGPYFCE